MANRNITDSTLLAAIGSNFQRNADLLTLTLGTTTYRFTNAAFNVTIDTELGSDEYLALGDFLSFSDVEEISDMTIASITISLSGVDVNTVYEWLTEDYIDKQVYIQRVYFDESWQVIGTPVLLFDGRIDAPSIRDTGTEVSVGCRASSQWVDFTRRNGRYTSNELNLVLYPGDVGFQYAGVDKVNLKWGG